MANLENDQVLQKTRVIIRKKNENHVLKSFKTDQVLDEMNILCKQLEKQEEITRLNNMSVLEIQLLFTLK